MQRKFLLTFQKKECFASQNIASHWLKLVKEMFTFNLFQFKLSLKPCLQDRIGIKVVIKIANGEDLAQKGAL